MRNILVLFILTTLMGCNSISKKDKELLAVNETIDKVLFIVSNQHTYGNTDLNASNHFAEIVYAYEEFIKADYTVDFVSPEGGAIPIGYLNTSSKLQKKYIYDADFMNKLKKTKAPLEIKASDYKAVYYGGGGAAMYGVPENEAIQNIVMEIYEQHNGILSAICNGTAGIVNLKNSDGQYVYAGKRVNGFPDKFENKEADYYKTFPFSIEETIKQRGGDFKYSEEGWNDFSVADGRLITGQDPTASRSVAKQVIKQLKAKLE